MATPTKKSPAPKAPKKSAKSVMMRDMTGKDIEAVDLPENIFSVKASNKLISQYVRVYLANQRQGTASAKTRSEVNATTKKVYRQKGTGRARHGARTANLFVGGGVTFGPKPRDFSLKLNKKQIVKALLYSLSLKADSNMIHVVDGFASLDHKTKASTGALKSLGLDKKVLVVYAPGQAEHLRKQLRNIKTVSSSQDRLLNAYKVLNAQNVVFTKEGFQDFITFRQKTA